MIRDVSILFTQLDDTCGNQYDSYMQEYNLFSSVPQTPYIKNRCESNVKL